MPEVMLDACDMQRNAALKIRFDDKSKISKALELSSFYWRNGLYSANRIHWLLSEPLCQWNVSKNIGLCVWCWYDRYSACSPRT